MDSKAEYLKKYLSGEETKKKRKRQIEKGASKKLGFKIIDEDDDLKFTAASTSREVNSGKKDSQFKNFEQKSFEAENDDDDNPVVVLVDNKTDELQLLGKFKVSNWTSVDSKNNPASSRANRDEDDLEPRRRRTIHDSDSSDGFSKHKRDELSAAPDISPPRRRKPSDPETSRSKARRLGSGDSSPKRPVVGHRRSESDNELSPVRRRAQYDKDKFLRRKKPKKELTEEEKRRQEEMKKKYEVWNKGAKQVKERKEKLQELAEIAEKPMARYENDVDLEKHLKDQLFDEDPMKAYVDKKREKAEPSRRPAYKGHAPANRYGILPGYRWDGVDRSNGFEHKLLSQANQKRAEQDEYYAWSSGRYE